MKTIGWFFLLLLTGALWPQTDFGPTLAMVQPILDAHVAEADRMVNHMYARVATLAADTRRGLGWFDGEPASFRSYGTVKDGWKLNVLPDRLVWENGNPPESASYRVLVLPFRPAEDGLTWVYWSAPDASGTRVQGWMAYGPDNGWRQLVIDKDRGPRLEMTPDGYLLRFADRELWYTTYEYLGVQDLRLGPALEAALIRAESDAAVRWLDLLSREASLGYQLDGYLAALRAGVALENEKDLSDFFLGRFRAAAGNAAFRWSNHLQTASFAHSRAVVMSGDAEKFQDILQAGGDINQVLAFHTERPGQSGFTGVHPSDRARAAGYPSWNTVGENGNFYGGVAESITGWFFSVYHRRPFLDPDITDAAVASFMDGNPRRRAVTMKFGKPDNTPAAIRFLPGNGEREVPPAWRAVEAPDPKGSLSVPVGPPVSVYLPMGGAAAARVSLRDDQGREARLFRVTEMASDNYAEFLPEKPLRPDSTYVARLTAGTEVRTWSFRTGRHPPKGGDLALPAMSLLHQALRRPRLPAAAQIYRDHNEPLSFRRVGQRLVLEPFGFSMAVPQGFTPSTKPDAPWLLHFERRASSPGGWAAFDLVFHRMGGERRLEVLAQWVEPKDWTWPRTVRETTRAGDVTAHFAEYAWDRPGTAHIAAGILSERGVSVWCYGLPARFGLEILAGLDPE